MAAIDRPGSADQTYVEAIKARAGDELYRSTSFAVSANDIRKHAMAVYWPDKPPRLFWDEDYAKGTVWGGIVASEDFNPFAWALEGPGRFPMGLGNKRGRWLNALSDARYFVPIRPGDVIAATETLLDPYERSGASGRMLFVPTETRWTNQRGELVKTQRGEEVLLMPQEKPPATRRSQTLRPAPPEQAASSFAKSNPRFEDVEEGQALPPFERTTDLQYWNRFAAVNDEFEDIHMDADFAKARGDRDVLAMGHLRFSYMHSFLRLWIGDSGIIRRVSCQYRGIQYKGDTVTCRGNVVRKYAENAEHLVEIDLWVENQNGEKIGPGRALVALPSDKD
ncbi:MAG: MaoC family dehydratase N-terminal domain-containing protein [Rhodobiaceae bacterium]|nr:MaoC family dehydratase N-terminal domain-containing protein [Rhodobiaceae bacterium]MCC0056415.1 MaoC family dehydratase N-terminal domain-containing protein [Rhodobiaceae bacterium]